MIQNFIVPARGGGKLVKHAAKAIRFARHGCTNRPFYHIVVMLKGRHQREQPIEQLGSYDPLPNKDNEKLVALNFERLEYWIADGAEISTPVAELLGLSGYMPVHPKTYLTSWRNRKLLNQESSTRQPEAS